MSQDYHRAIPGPGAPISAASAADRISGIMSSTSPEDDGGPEQLFSILEEVARGNETPLLTPEEVQRRRDVVEQGWDQVRRWLWTHESHESRAAAAYVRGHDGTTALHLMCKLRNPPSEVITEMIEAAPEIVGWVDNSGWLPLHHACANGSSTEVLRILTSAYPESKVVQDGQDRTPLHFYLTRTVANPTAMATDVELLGDTGAVTMPDCRGMLPMHYACAYGNHPAVLQVLMNAYPGSVTARENNGRTPMHLAMVNSHRDISPGVIRFLLENGGSTTLDVNDHDGHSPLHMLNDVVKKRGNIDEAEPMHNISECLKLYLDASTDSSPDFLNTLQNLPDWLQEVAVVSQRVRDVLNEKIMQRFPTSILMMDGYMLLIIIVCFEIASIAHIDLRFGSESGRSESDVKPALFLLYIGASYFLLRELIQVVALWSAGSIASWFSDTTNWLDMAVIILTFYYSVWMTLGSTEDETGLGVDTFRAGCAFTKGVLWMAVIYFLKSTQVDFAVFLGGVFYVVRRLVAFLVAVGVILFAFAQMFFVIYRQTDVCTQPIPSDESGNECSGFPHCTFGDSLLKVYTMMMGEIGSESRYNDNFVAQILYVAYAFLVVILLSNVLIAIVTDSYEIIQNDRAAIVFWSNRLDFISEMEGMKKVVRQRLFCMTEKERRPSGMPAKIQEGPNGSMVLHRDGFDEESNDIFRASWSLIMNLFESNSYDEVEKSGPFRIEFWVTLIFRGVALFVILPVWILLGLATAGILWPPQVREYLFAQKETAMSRAEIERAKLEQLRDIQGDIKGLKIDIRKEMASDRDEMIRLKDEVEAVQSQVLADLQQVKELMTTLLDLGGIQES